MTANEILRRAYTPGTFRQWFGERLFWVLWASPTFRDMMMEIPKLRDDNAETRNNVMNQNKWVIRKLEGLP